MAARQTHTIGFKESAPAMDDEAVARRTRGASFTSLANRCVAQGEARRAIPFYQQALEIAQETGDGQGAGAALGGLSQAYTQLGEPRRAMEAYERALDIAREPGGQRFEEPSTVPTRQRLGALAKTMVAASLSIAVAGIVSMIGFLGGQLEESRRTARTEGCARHAQPGATCVVVDLAKVTAAPEATASLVARNAPDSDSIDSSTTLASASLAPRQSEWRLGTPTTPPTTIPMRHLPPAEGEGAITGTQPDRDAPRDIAALVQPEQTTRPVAASSSDEKAGPTAPELPSAGSGLSDWKGESLAAEVHYPTVNPDRRVAAQDRVSRSRSARPAPATVQSNRDRLVRSGLLYASGAGRGQDKWKRTEARRAASDPRTQIAALGTSDVPLVAEATTRGVLTAQSQEGSEEEEDDSRLSDEPSPFLGEGDIPDRPPLLLEIGDPFLDTGELDQGFELPTGAVWQPRLWIFGTQRSAIQTIDTGDEDRISEWVNRLDLFGNLQLTGTEKVVVGIRPWDQNQPNDFSGYRFEPIQGKGFRNDLNVDIRTLFAEGDFGSLLPNLDPEGQTLLDFGFTVGRQPLIFQDGILISDTQDTVGLVRNNIRLPGVSNLRIAGIYSSDLFDETTRSAGGVPLVEDENLQLTGLFTEWDTRYTTINADAIYAWDDTQTDGDGFYAGISAAQRLGEINSTFRVNGSLAQEDQSVLVRDGILVSSELSWTPYSTNDTLYFNPFVAFGEYLQAAREEVDGGGPLAPIGILFASPNIGEFGSEMNNRANDVVGVAVGYQAFWDDNRRNLAVEIAARHDLGLDDGAVIATPEGALISLDGFDQYGAGFQFQQAIGQRAIVQLEGFGVLQEDRNDSYGGRLEFLYQF